MKSSLLLLLSLSIPVLAAPLPPRPFAEYAPHFEAKTQTLTVPCLRVPGFHDVITQKMEFFYAVKFRFSAEKWHWEMIEVRPILIDSDEFRQKCLKPEKKTKE